MKHSCLNITMKKPLIAEGQRFQSELGDFAHFGEITRNGDIDIA